MLADSHAGPFGHSPRFAFLDFAAGSDGQSRSGRLGTYGLIRNARLFVAGAIAPSAAHDHLYDYGYCLQRIVLELTRRGLGTCWLQAFERKRLQGQLGVRPGEAVPAVVVCGYPAPTESRRARVFRSLAGSERRKPWSALFFETASGNPLADPFAAGPFREPLEAVRLAPSATNRQPWRVFVDLAAGAFDFYVKGQAAVDLGIAMAHFALVMGESGFAGEWAAQRPALERPGLGYVLSWRSSPGR